MTLGICVHWFRVHWFQIEIVITGKVWAGSGRIILVGPILIWRSRTCSGWRINLGYQATASQPQWSIYRRVIISLIFTKWRREIRGPIGLERSDFARATSGMTRLWSWRVSRFKFLIFNLVSLVVSSPLEVSSNHPISCLMIALKYSFLALLDCRSADRSMSVVERYPANMFTVMYYTLSDLSSK